MPHSNKRASAEATGLPRRGGAAPRNDKTKKGGMGDWQALKGLFKLIIEGRKAKCIVVVIAILVNSVAIAGNAFFTMILVNNYIVPLVNAKTHGQPVVFTGLTHAVLLMAAICAVGVVANLVSSRMMAIMGQDVQQDIRNKMFAHMQTLPIGYFDTHAFGDIMSYYTNDIDTLRQMITQSIPQVLTAAITLLAAIVAMFIISPILLIIVLAIFVIDAVVVRWVQVHSSRHFTVQQEALGKLDGYIEEMIQGQRVVKVFNHQKRSQESFDEHNDVLRESAYRANAYSNILMPILVNTGYLQYALIAVVGAVLFLTDKAIGITLGAVASFVQLGRVFSVNLARVSQQTNYIIMALAGTKRILRFLEAESEQDSGYIDLVEIEDGYAWSRLEADGATTLIPLQGDIVLDHVDFSYVPEKPILHDISMRAKPGQKLALVGATGAGKTTITNLITRFYDIDAGTIYYDGLDIRDIKKSALRRSFGVVLQDTNLFTGTVYDNIRYGRLNASDADIRRAAEYTDADGFIQTLAEGYETEVSGGSDSLSQGQRQLLSIARAAIADPPAMVLDEATSSIDTRTEKLIQSGMDTLMSERTTFVIAHRLSTIRNA
ncbi:MAG: ABC transporter ATP-binding protein/permease, partial [Coriobacteriia bacterium]|nr:ABC transporter ATP-binding protein/permease [Coriobacteriia bacterium]